MAAQNIDDLLGPEFLAKLDAQKQQILGKFQELFAGVNDYATKGVSPINVSGLTEFNATVKTMAASVDILNAKLTELTTAYNTSTNAGKKKAEELTDEDRIAKEHVKTLQRLQSENAKLAASLSTEHKELERVKLERIELNKQLREELKLQDPILQAKLKQEAIDKQIAKAEKDAAQAKRDLEKQAVADRRTAREQKATQLAADKKAAAEEIALQKQINASLIGENRQEELNTNLKKQSQIQIKALEKEYLLLRAAKGADNEETLKTLSLLRAAKAEYATIQEVIKPQSGLASFSKSLTGGLSALRTAAYILPGIGIAGIFNLAGEAIGKMFDRITEGSAEAVAAREAMEEYNKTIEEIGQSATSSANQEIVSAKVLIGIAQDRNIADETRYNSAKKLQELYPSILGNLSTETIMTGDLTNATNLLTQALVQKNLAEAYSKKAATAQDAAIVTKEEYLKQYKVYIDKLAELQKEENLTIGSDPYAGLTYSARISKTADDVTSELNKLNALKAKLFQNELDVNQYTNQAIIAGGKAGDLFVPSPKLTKTPASKVDKNITKDAEDEMKQSELVSKFIIKQNEIVISNQIISAKRRIELLMQNVAIEKAIINERAEFEKNKKGVTATQIEFLTTEAQFKIIEIEQAALIKSNEIFIQQQATKTAYLKQALKEREKLEKQAADDAKNLQESIENMGDEAMAHQIKNREDDAKDQDRKDKIKKANYRRAENELFDFAKNLLDSYYEEKEAKIQRDIELTSKQRELEMDGIKSSTLAQKDKAAYERQLSATKMADEKAAAKEIRKLKHDNAVVDKAISIAQIIANTAQAVTAALAEPLLGPAVALSIGVLGAAQLAKVIATKIPSYAEGGVHQQDGFARYGEAGAEWVKKPGHKPFLATQETISLMPKGTEFIPTYGAVSISERRRDDSWAQTKYLATQIKKNNKEVKNVIHTHTTIDFGFEIYKKTKING